MTDLQHKQQLMAIIVASLIDNSATIDIYNLIEDADKIVRVIIERTKTSSFTASEHNDY
jgi:hypothetical protein